MRGSLAWSCEKTMARAQRRSSSLKLHEKHEKPEASEAWDPHRSSTWIARSAAALQPDETFHGISASQAMALQTSLPGRVKTFWAFPRTVGMACARRLHLLRPKSAQKQLLAALSVMRWDGLPRELPMKLPASGPSVKSCAWQGREQMIILLWLIAAGLEVQISFLARLMTQQAAPSIGNRDPKKTMQSLCVIWHGCGHLPCLYRTNGRGFCQCGPTMWPKLNDCLCWWCLGPMPLLQPGWAGIGTAQAFQALETFSLETCSLIKAE